MIEQFDAVLEDTVGSGSLAGAVALVARSGLVIYAAQSAGETWRLARA